ncbi:MAG: hypothetical protein ACLUKN_02445 [Bacilli bacterium]
MMNERMNPVRIVSNAAKDWDGGYTLYAIGNGDAFVLRTPTEYALAFI